MRGVLKAFGLIFVFLVAAFVYLPRLGAPSTAVSASTSHSAAMADSKTGTSPSPKTNAGAAAAQGLIPPAHGENASGHVKELSPSPSTLSENRTAAGGVIKSLVSAKANSYQCQHDLHVGIDYIGHDVGSMPANSAGECCVYCQDNRRCGAFTFVKDMCWFKSSSAAQQPLPNTECTSGTVRTTDRHSRRRRSSKPSGPPPPPPPWYAIYLWLLPPVAALVACIAMNVMAGIPLLKHEGGADCSTEDCCECE